MTALDHPENPMPRRPTGRPAMYMTWRTLLFIHWPVPAALLQPLVPRGLKIDTHEGRAWVGLVPFTMQNVRVAFLPKVPTTHRFHECNVRTYVTTEGVPGEPGVWFFSLDAVSRLAVLLARRLWRLNYLHAKIEIARSGDEVSYTLERQRRRSPRRPKLRCRWRSGAPLTRSRPGELAHFLTERYLLYTVNRNGVPRRGRIWHRPWSLREAELLELDEELLEAARIDVPRDKTPIVFAGDAIDVQAWLPE